MNVNTIEHECKGTYTLVCWQCWTVLEVLSAAQSVHHMSSRFVAA